MLKKLLLLCILSFHFSTYSQSREVKIISWNIRDFGKTKNSEELDKIADIVRDTDILAIQEVVSGYGGAQAVAKLADALNRKGSKWDYVISNPTNSSKYVTERYAFIWKTKYIKIKNRGFLVKELDEKVEREPFLLDFYVNGDKFTVLNFHSRPYNKDPESEIKEISKYILDRFTSPILFVGDFNVNNKNTAFTNLKDKGYKAAVVNKKTTLKKKCYRGQYVNHAIDNIFYSKKINKVDSKVLDFIKNCTNLETGRYLSDHLPVYMKFSIVK
ncbi:MAG: endonuclease/exonuclease/phosphatase family protein [Cellulophaga sp.]|uniref:endonuclease/exonuclease/phosphatase family protein n=1 Tax=Cellulophaga sp. TaxID=1972202 RepID=UPI0032644277